MSAQIYHKLMIGLEDKNVKIPYDTPFGGVNDACVASNKGHLKSGLTLLRKKTKNIDSATVGTFHTV